MLRVVGDAPVVPESPGRSSGMELELEEGEGQEVVSRGVSEEDEMDTEERVSERVRGRREKERDEDGDGECLLAARQVKDKLKITPEVPCKSLRRSGESNGQINSQSQSQRQGQGQGQGGGQDERRFRGEQSREEEQLELEQQQYLRKRKRDTNSLQKKQRSHRRDAESRNKSDNSNRSGSNDDTVASDANHDHIGHHCGTPGMRIKDRYEIVREIGMGTFGKVFTCLDHKYNGVVAVKVVRSIKRYVESAKIEADILDHVYDRQAKQKTNYCLKLYSHFKFDNYYFLVTEKLGPSLYDILKGNKYKGFPMRLIRQIARQLLQAMNFLKSMNLIHTDLKVENVLFVGDLPSLSSDSCDSDLNDNNGESYSRRGEAYPYSSLIKIIDFGGATYDNEKKSTIINTRQYRSPEVLLETRWSFPSDIWSVGCIIAEIYIGGLLFQTHGNLEHLALIERCCGLFPYRLLKESHVSRDYFDSRGKTRLNELSSESQGHVRNMKRLRDVFALDKDHRDRSGIADLMKELLEVDPGRRATASQALQMTFVR